MCQLYSLIKRYTGLHSSTQSGIKFIFTAKIFIHISKTKNLFDFGFSSFKTSNCRKIKKKKKSKCYSYRIWSWNLACMFVLINCISLQSFMFLSHAIGGEKISKLLWTMSRSFENVFTFSIIFFFFIFQYFRKVFSFIVELIIY